MGYPKKHRGRRKRGSKYRRNKKRQKKLNKSGENPIKRPAYTKVSRSGER